MASVNVSDLVWVLVVLFIVSGFGECNSKAGLGEIKDFLTAVR